MNRNELKKLIDKRIEYTNEEIELIMKKVENGEKVIDFDVLYIQLYKRIQFLKKLIKEI